MPDGRKERKKKGLEGFYINKTGFTYYSYEHFNLVLDTPVGFN